MLKRKRLVLVCIFFSFLTSYILFSVWIANDVRIILRTGMQNDANYRDYMSSDVYQNINPMLRNMTSADYTYNAESHSIGMPVPLHFFGIAKVWVTHRYNAEIVGFEEPVTLTLKLKKGKWYAANVHIKP